MILTRRLRRTVLAGVTAAAFAASAGTASASPCETGWEHRSDNAPGGAATAVDEHRPAGAGTGRKVG